MASLPRRLWALWLPELARTRWAVAVPGPVRWGAAVLATPEEAASPPSWMRAAVAAGAMAPLAVAASPVLLAVLAVAPFWPQQPLS